MGKLDAAQKQWLVDLGVMLGSDAEVLKATLNGGPEAVAGEPTAAAPKPIEALEDRRREFKRARAQWVTVKQRAEEDLEKVKAGARTT